jgi:5'-3' exonuclease
MVRRLLWLLRDYRPTHLAICWDVSRESLFRRQLYPEYKGLREKKPASLEEQYETAWQLFEKMNIPQFKVQGYEADDLLGTIAQRWKEEVGDPCYLVSSDHDLYQMLDENVSILRYKKGQGDGLYTRSDFVKEYGIEPRQWIDVKALLGEPGKGDNIPGVKHVGEDGAFPLIQQYGCIENLYNNIHELEGTKFKRYIKHLLRDSETAAISKKLVRIVTDVPELQSTQMDELTLRIDKAAMIGEFQRLGFKTILNEIAEGKYKAS